MYLKEDSLFISAGAVSGYKYTTLYDNNDYVNTQIASETDTSVTDTSVTDTSVTDTSVTDTSEQIEPDKKCLFYTFFFGIIGYLLYYVFKDTM